jgi:phage-related protein (TIGR01555 family)
MPGFPMPEDQRLPGQDTEFPVSIYDIANKELTGAGATEGTADSLIQKSSLIAWTVPALTAAVQGGHLASLMARFRIVNRFLSSNRIMVLAPGEDVKEVGYRWSGLAEMLLRNKSRVSAAVDIPVTRLYGESMTGLAGDSLKGDRFNYFEGNVQGHVQETKLRPPMERLVDLAMMAADGPTFGNAIPYRLTWNSPITLTELEKAELRQKDAQTFATFIDLGVLRPDEVRESLFGGLEYNSDITLIDVDVSRETPPELEPEPPPVESPEADNPEPDNEIEEVE